MEKLKLMGSMRENKDNKSAFNDNMDYITSIFRTFMSHDPSIQFSMQLRGTHDYKFFEIYCLDKDTFQFKMKGDLELYVNKKILGMGHFHEVSEAL